MKTSAALACIVMLATVSAHARVHAQSVSVTGGATPTVGTSAQSTSNTQSTSNATISPQIRSGNSDARVSTRTTNRAQGGRSSSSARGGSSGAVGNQVQIVQEGYTGGNDPPYSGAQGTQGTGYSGSFTQTLRNVPEIVAPSVNGGANGCAVGVSGGVAVAGFGITTGAGWSDPDCERRQLAALTYNMNDHELAQEILCDSKEVRAARVRLGKPCVVDRPPQANVAVNVTQSIDPAILRRQDDARASIQPLANVHTKPDWCETASPQELRAHHECD